MPFRAILHHHMCTNDWFIMSFSIRKLWESMKKLRPFPVKCFTIFGLCCKSLIERLFSSEYHCTEYWIYEMRFLCDMSYWDSSEKVYRLSQRKVDSTFILKSNNFSENFQNRSKSFLRGKGIIIKFNFKPQPCRRNTKSVKSFIWSTGSCNPSN